jgi:hypothetical protein
MIWNILLVLAGGVIGLVVGFVVTCAAVHGLVREARDREPEAADDREFERERALRRALKFHRGRGDPSLDVVATADHFEQFVRQNGSPSLAPRDLSKEPDAI